MVNIVRLRRLKDCLSFAMARSPLQTMDWINNCPKSMFEFLVIVNFMVKYRCINFIPSASLIHVGVRTPLFIYKYFINKLAISNSA